MFTSNTVYQPFHIRSVKGHNVESIFISLCLTQVLRIVENADHTYSFLMLLFFVTSHVPFPPVSLWGGEKRERSK